MINNSKPLQISPDQIDGDQSQPDGGHSQDEGLKLLRVILAEHLDQDRGRVQLGKDHHDKPGIDHESLADNERREKEAGGDDPKDVPGQADPDPDIFESQVEAERVGIIKQCGEDRAAEVGKVLERKLGIIIIIKNVYFFENVTSQEVPV